MSEVSGNPGELPNAVGSELSDGLGAEIENLCIQIQLHKTGANAHSANKSCMYLNIFYKGGEHDTCRRLMRQMNLALATGDWRQLHDYMGAWW